jgi:nicotinamidase-related amidase
MNNHALLKPAECCLHIIDPQKSLMARIHQAGKVVRVIKLMMESARIFNMPIIANTQYRKGLGPYVDELEILMEAIPRPDKKEFNAYANGTTQTVLETLAKTVTTVILVGVETHICIYQSAMGALQRGFVPWIVADGVSSRSRENHQLGLARLQAAGAIIGPAEMIIYELLGMAGTPEFKQLLPHIIAFNETTED